MTARASILGRRALLVGWLVAVWLLLWGTWRLDVFLLGILVAVAAVSWSRLPAPVLRTRIRLRALPGLLFRFLVDMGRSSWEVALATVRAGRNTTSAVLAVPVPPATSDLAMMILCNRITLEPGTIVVDVDRHHDLMFVYRLDTPDRASVERGRAEIQQVVDDVLATFSPRDGGER